MMIEESYCTLTQIDKLTIAVVEFIVQDYLGTDLVTLKVCPGRFI